MCCFNVGCGSNNQSWGVRRSIKSGKVWNFWGRVCKKVRYQCFRNLSHLKQEFQNKDKFSNCIFLGKYVCLKIEIKIPKYTSKSKPVWVMSRNRPH